jgi:hypothetical protein
MSERDGGRRATSLAPSGGRGSEGVVRSPQPAEERPRGLREVYERLPHPSVTGERRRRVLEAARAPWE